MSEGQGFQFTPMGIVPLGQPAPAVNNEDLGTLGAAAAGRAGLHAVPAQPVEPAPTTAQPVQPQALARPKRVTAAGLRASVRAEIRALERELRRLKPLAAELARLRALLKSMTPAPKLAAVRTSRAG